MDSICREEAPRLLQPKMKLGIVSMVAVFFIAVLMLSNAWAVNAADPKEEMKEAAEAVSEYSVEQKDEAVGKAQEMLNDLDDSIESIENRLAPNWDELKQSTREQYRDTLRTLRKKRNKLSEYYGSLQHSSKDAWQEVRDGFTESYNQLMLSWQETATKMQQEGEKQTD